MRALPSQRRIDRIRLPFRPTQNDREILLGDALFLHQQAETPRGRGILGHQHQAARLAVEPINDGDLPAIRDLERQKLLQFSPKRSRLTRLCRMNEKKRWLLDDDEVVGLRNDREIATVVCAARLDGG
jgi:hypothetical protein